jgi:predicted nucleotidyltransferase
MMSDRWLEKFKQRVIPQLIREFQPEKLVLFGSRIKGGADEDSDIDVIIVSKAFAGIPFVKRMPLILKKIRFDKHIDFICYSPTEFRKIKNTSSVVMDALQYGESQAT